MLGGTDTMQRGRVVGAVDIGTSKVVVFVGEITGKGRLEIIGKGECSSRGMTKGEVVDLKTASDCVHSAISQAEQNAEVKIPNFFLSQSGRHIEGFYHQGIANVMNADNVVSQADLQRALEEARNKKIADGKIYIHKIRNSLKLDEETVVDPVGMIGERVQTGYWLVTGNEKKVSQRIGMIRSLDAMVDDLILSSVASGMMISTQSDKDNGSIVIDIGSGTTDYVVYKSGAILCTGVIPVGGDHLTNDLSLGLRINRKHAEKLKMDSGKAIVDESDMNDKVWSVGDKSIGDRHVPKRAIYKILNARVQELFEIIHKQVSAHAHMEDFIAGAILTGGTSRLYGIDQVAEGVLGLPVRRGEHPSWVGNEIDRPEYSSALGLFHYVLTAPGYQEEPKKKPMNLLKSLLNFK